ncbi:hypothetical protein [Metabacillus sp. Hm71]|uniref:hypothetical protein n=1 Tax=Metabacillus sp. Hm71 TaxID=3450743 RepID=UPI003F42347C
MENENCGIMTTTKKTDIHGYTCTMVHLMDFRRARLWHVNFENLDNEPIPDGLREYIRENSEKIKEGRYHYSGPHKK